MHSLGLEGDDGKIKYLTKLGNLCYVSLVSLNDSGLYMDIIPEYKDSDCIFENKSLTFDEIADILEMEYILKVAA